MLAPPHPPGSPLLEAIQQSLPLVAQSHARAQIARAAASHVPAVADVSPSELDDALAGAEGPSSCDVVEDGAGVGSVGVVVVDGRGADVFELSSPHATATDEQAREKATKA